MSESEIRTMLQKLVSPESIAKFQELVDQMVEQGQFVKYLQQHKLGLIDSRLDVLDKLLDAGLVKVKA